MPDVSAPAPDRTTSCLAKKRYSTEAHAMEIAAKCLRLRGAVLRVYPCSYCGGHHLTRQRRPPNPTGVKRR
jgi:hypothetical protein